jgi:cytosine/uracil/thiamine/allantoin permease
VEVALSGFVFHWLGGYGGGMGAISGGYGGGVGAISGVMIADYSIIGRRHNLPDLLSPTGSYRYSGGWNMGALSATVVGLFLPWGGYVMSGLHFLIDYGWSGGFFASALSTAS